MKQERSIIRRWREEKVSMTDGHWDVELSLVDLLKGHK
jgi:hypothetical protein